MIDSKHLGYKRAIIKELAFGRVISSIEVAERIQKSLPLTNKLLSEMVVEGILTENGYATSTGGRRPITFSILENRMYIISVSMDQFVTRIGLIDIHGVETLHIEKHELPLSNNNDSYRALLEIIQNYIKHPFVCREKLLGIGIGMPGFVDVKKGVNHTYLKPGTNKSLRDSLEQDLGIPVLLDNDSSLVALAELTLGQARNTEHSMVINFGWGVGLGIIVNGELFRGHNGFAGEFSHIPVFTNNKLCDCGKSGCLETEASLLVIVEKAKAELATGRVSALHDLPDEVEAASETIIQAALAGDQLAVELLANTAYDIGKCIAILIHIFNPQKVIISGRGARAGSILLAPIYQAIHKYCIPRLASYTSVWVSDFHIRAEMLGAAALVLENIEKNSLIRFFTRNTTLKSSTNESL